jgi:hypothetical protein
VSVDELCAISGSHARPAMDLSRTTTGGARLLQYGLFGVGVKARRAGGQLLLPSVAARGGVVRSEGLS